MGNAKKDSNKERHKNPKPNKNNTQPTADNEETYSSPPRNKRPGPDQQPSPPKKQKIQCQFCKSPSHTAGRCKIFCRKCKTLVSKRPCEHYCSLCETLDHGEDNCERKRKQKSGICLQCNTIHSGQECPE